MKDVFGSLYAHREQRPSLADEIERDKKIAPIFGGDLLKQLKAMRHRRTMMRRIMLLVALIYAAGLTAFIALIMTRNSAERPGHLPVQVGSEKHRDLSSVMVVVDTPKVVRQAIAQWKDAGEHLQEARVWVQKGRRDTAANILQETLNANPENVEVLFELAQLYFQQGANDRARGLLHRLLSIDPQRKAAIQMLATIYSRTGQHEQALVLASWILESDTDSTEAHRVAGLAYLKANRLDLALAHFRKWVTAEPDNIMAQKQYADVLLNLKDYEKARAIYEIILKKKPDEADAYRQLAVCFAKQTMVEQAVSTMIQATYNVGAPKVVPWFKDPGFESVRNQKLFALLERQMSMPHVSAQVIQGSSTQTGPEAGFDPRSLEKIQAMLKPLR